RRLPGGSRQFGAHGDFMQRHRCHPACPGWVMFCCSELDLRPAHPPPPRDIESSVGFRTHPVVWVFRIENFCVSVWVFRTEPSVGFPHWFLNFLLLPHRPLAMAEALLLARAAAAICSASSRVLIFRQSWLGGACLPPRAYANVSRNKVGSRYSAFPPRPCL